MDIFNAVSTFVVESRVYRIGPFSAIDTLGAYGIVLLVSPLLVWLWKKVGIETTILEWLALVLPMGLLAHIIFQVRTPFTEMFLGSGSWFAKIVLVAMVCFGVKGFVRAFYGWYTGR